MPKKIRQLKSMLRKAGFTCQSGKGSHTKWTHPRRKALVVLSGNDGEDAKPYQEQEVRQALADVKRKKCFPATAC
jgi:predicted RNA binding protein YcfA (HicA-like mRNA interferase family)